VSAKHALLVAAVIAVLGMGVYLFIEVNATPAKPSATQVTAREPTATPPHEEVAREPKHPGDTKTSWARPPIPSATPRPPTGNDVASSPSEDDDGRKVNLKLDNLMELANKAYDAQDFDQATAIAGKVLSRDPNNVRMLRIMVSANCIQGDSVAAQQNYEKLPKFDREQMKTRCDRYGVTFKDPP
jgi:hypothetical protein